MTETPDPRQIHLFPELSEHPDLPSITTLPEFDHALNNLIKISDLGAFIQLKIQGMDKRYSLHFREPDIPPDFLKPEARDQSLKTFYLFPDELRRTLKKMAYEVKSFFNSRNSFRTTFGFFLFRSHFSLWKHYLEETQKNMDKTLYKILGQGRYTRFLLECLQNGGNYFQAYASDLAPWSFDFNFHLKELEQRRLELRDQSVSLSSLKPTEISFPRDLLVLKTLHFPLRLSAYVAQIQITSIFKTIHLEYLVKKNIQSIEDVKRLVEEM